MSSGVKNNETKPIRWQQRFRNFEKAFILLQQIFNEKPLDQFSDLEKEGIVQRFKYTFELAWKTLKDYLEYTGITLEQLTPYYVIKQVFSAKIIKDGQIWMDMLAHRNLMSHTYHRETFYQELDELPLPNLTLRYIRLSHTFLCGSILILMQKIFMSEIIIIDD